LNPYSIGGFDFSSINKDNIFSADVLSKLTGTAPLNNVVKVKEPKVTKHDPTEAGINLEKTAQLNSYLSSLGFTWGASTGSTNQQNKSDVDENLQIMARAKEGIYLVNDSDNNYLEDKSKLICEAGHASVFSSDGSMLAVSSKISSRFNFVVR